MKYTGETRRTALEITDYFESILLNLNRGDTFKYQTITNDFKDIIEPDLPVGKRYSIDTRTKVDSIMELIYNVLYGFIDGQSYNDISFSDKVKRILQPKNS